MRQGKEAVCEALLAARRVFLVPHVGIDGDDLGSMVALHAALESLGKEVWAYCPEPVPTALRSLPGQERLSGRLPDAEVDVVVTMECPTASRLPPGVDVATLGGLVANVDHHPDNERHGDLLWIDPSAAALGEMVFDLIEALGVDLDPTIATALYVAIFSDTGSFQFPRVTPDTHRRVARLLEQGVATDVLGRQILREEPFRALKLYGRVLSRIRLEGEGRVAWTEIHGRDMEESGLRWDQVRHFVERIDQVRGSQVVVLFSEYGPSRIKVSLRSRRVPVNEVAARFGGGGHHLAAGCVVDATLPEARRMILEDVVRTLDGAASG